MRISVDPKVQLEHLKRGIAELYTETELLARLERSMQKQAPLIVKLGLDPTAPDVHLGHAVVLRKARAFQDFGHKVVIIIGDFTARIGDPSGKTTTRPVLTGAEVMANAKTYMEQVGRILDTDPLLLQLRPNREWLEHLNFEDVLRLAGKITVARLMERDTFENRWKANEPIGFHEFFYPLMQGYDSIAISSDVELGGTDQTYNNLFGRDMQRSFDKEPQVVMTMPILRGLDGVKKMSKSLDNYIGIMDDANTMVQKIFSMPDELVGHYFELLTDADMREIERELTAGNVVEQKRRLAGEVALAFHDAAAVATALANLSADVPAEMEVVAIKPDDLDAEGKIWVVKLLTLCGFTGSNKDLRARIAQGALRIDGTVINDEKASLALPAELTLSFGPVKKKTNWRRVVRGA